MHLQLSKTNFSLATNILMAVIWEFSYFTIGLDKLTRLKNHEMDRRLKIFDSLHFKHQKDKNR